MSPNTVQMGSSHYTNRSSFTAALLPGQGGRSLPIGKPPVMLLHTLPVRDARSRDPRVIVGVRYVIVNTDSRTFVTEEIDVHALAINANPLAIMIALPRWFLATILVPAGTIVRVGMSRIFSQIG